MTVYFIQGMYMYIRSALKYRNSFVNKIKDKYICTFAGINTWFEDSKNLPICQPSENKAYIHSEKYVQFATEIENVDRLKLYLATKFIDLIDRYDM